MPTNYSPTPTAYTGGAVTRLVDGDPVNEDNLMKEASPGGTPKVTFALLLDYIAGITDGTTGILAKLAKQTATAGEALIGVQAYSGTSFTKAAGTLQTFLNLLADKAAKLDATLNTFTGGVTINGAMQAGSQVILGTSSLQGNTTFSADVGPSGSAARVKWRIANMPDVASTTVDVTAEIWWASSPSNNMTIILDKTTHVPTAGQMVRVALYNMSTKTVAVTNGSGGATIASGGTGSGTVYTYWIADFIYINGNWHLAQGVGQIGNGTSTNHFVAGSPEGV